MPCTQYHCAHDTLNSLNVQALGAGEESETGLCWAIRGALRMELQRDAVGSTPPHASKLPQRATHPEHSAMR
jgi:hypothetical protein